MRIAQNQKMTEKEMVREIAGKLESILGADFYIREFSAGYGIADLVFTHGLMNSNHLKRTLITNYYVLSVFLSLRPQNEISFYDLTHEFPSISEPKLKKILQYLVENGYILKIGKNTYKIRKNTFSNPIKKVIAVEAKLTDYKAGLVQAKRYQYFADECYVVLLKRAYEKLDLKEYKQSNIGIIVYDEKNGDIKLKLKPRVDNSKKVQNINIFAKEILYSKYLNF